LNKGYISVTGGGREAVLGSAADVLMASTLKPFSGLRMMQRTQTA
jgi:hypothetical protein